MAEELFAMVKEAVKDKERADVQKAFEFVQAAYTHLPTDTHDNVVRVYSALERHSFLSFMDFEVLILELIRNYREAVLEYRELFTVGSCYVNKVRGRLLPQDTGGFLDFLEGLREYIKGKLSYDDFKSRVCNTILFNDPDSMKEFVSGIPKKDTSSQQEHADMLYYKGKSSCYDVRTEAMNSRYFIRFALRNIPYHLFDDMMTLYGDYHCGRISLARLEVGVLELNKEFLADNQLSSEFRSQVSPELAAIFRRNDYIDTCREKLLLEKTEDYVSLLKLQDEYEERRHDFRGKAQHVLRDQPTLLKELHGYLRIDSSNEAGSSSSKKRKSE